MLHVSLSPPAPQAEALRNSLAAHFAEQGRQRTADATALQTALTAQAEAQRTSLNAHLAEQRIQRTADAITLQTALAAQAEAQRVALAAHSAELRAALAAHSAELERHFAENSIETSSRLKAVEDKVSTSVERRGPTVLFLLTTQHYCFSPPAKPFFVQISRFNFVSMLLPIVLAVVIAMMMIPLLGNGRA